MIEVYSPSGKLICSHISVSDIKTTYELSKMFADLDAGILSKITLAGNAKISLELFGGACSLVCKDGCYLVKQAEPINSDGVSIISNVISFKSYKGKTNG